MIFIKLEIFQISAVSNKAYFSLLKYVQKFFIDLLELFLDSFEPHFLQVSQILLRGLKLLNADSALDLGIKQAHALKTFLVGNVR